MLWSSGLQPAQIPLNSPWQDLYRKIFKYSIMFYLFHGDTLKKVSVTYINIYTGCGKKVFSILDIFLISMILISYGVFRNSVSVISKKIQFLSIWIYIIYCMLNLFNKQQQNKSRKTYINQFQL